MSRFLALVLALAMVSCASAPSDPPGAGSPQTVAISLPPSDATMGGSPTIMVTTHRDTRGVEHTFSVSPEQIWRVLPQVYEELQIPLGVIDPERRRIGNTALSLQRTLGRERISTYLNCGDGPFGNPLADNYRVTASVVTSLEPGAGGTRVSTRLTATAVNPAVSGAPVNCGSTGRLEEQIARAIVTRLTP